MTIGNPFGPFAVGHEATVAAGAAVASRHATARRRVRASGHACGRHVGLHRRDRAVSCQSAERTNTPPYTASHEPVSPRGQRVATPSPPHRPHHPASGRNDGADAALQRSCVDRPHPTIIAVGCDQCGAVVETAQGRISPIWTWPSAANDTATIQYRVRFLQLGGAQCPRWSRRNSALTRSRRARPDGRRCWRRSSRSTSQRDPKYRWSTLLCR